MEKLLPALIPYWRSTYYNCKLSIFTEISNSTRNTQMLRRLPSGLTATATIQVAGRGRGNNVWVSPAGSLIFSTIVRHPVSLLGHAPVVFLQYLAALAIVEGIKKYDHGFQNVPVKLKWPNDICKRNPIRSFDQVQDLATLTLTPRCSQP